MSNSPQSPVYECRCRSPMDAKVEKPHDRPSLPYGIRRVLRAPQSLRMDGTYGKIDRVTGGTSLNRRDGAHPGDNGVDTIVGHFAENRPGAPSSLNARVADGQMKEPLGAPAPPRGSLLTTR